MEIENIHDWSIRMAAARDMLIKIRDGFPDYQKGKQRIFFSDRAVDEAIYNLLISDKKNMDKFLNDQADIWCKPVEYDKKGKVIKYKAFFK